MKAHRYIVLVFFMIICKWGFSQHGNLGVQVIDSSTFEGIPNVEILLEYQGGITRHDFTRNDGKAGFKNVPEGEAEITVINPTGVIVNVERVKRKIRIVRNPSINSEIFYVRIRNPKYFFFGEVTSKHGDYINSTKVILRNIDTIAFTFTDEYGVYRFTIPESKFESAKYWLEINKDEYEPYKDEEHVPINKKKFEKDIVLIPKIIPCIGTVEFKQFLNEQKRKPLQIGLGFGVQTSGSVRLNIIPSDIRHIPVHPDDRHFFYEEPARILDTINPTNYTLLENSVNIPLKQRFGLVLFNIGLYGLLNIEVKTTSLKASPETLNENYYVKQYLMPEPGKQYEGSANIFYSVVCKERQLFSVSSFSLPLSLSYPLLYIGKKTQYTDRLIINLSAGTNVLLPSKVNFQAISGWERFNAQEIYQTYDIGSIKEVEWFGGLSITGSFSELFRYYFLFNAINTTYKSDLIVPIQIQTDNAWSFSMNFRVAVMIGSKSKNK